MRRARSKVARRPCRSISRPIAVQKISSSCGVTTMVVTRSSRSASKMTRGLRERT